MKTIFCKPYQIKKHKIIENFPNKQIKHCIDSKGEKYKLHIIYPNDTIKIKVLDETEVLWFTGKSDLKVTMLTLNWMPKELFCGVSNGFYNQFSELAKKTGYIRSVNTGTTSLCFLSDKVQVALNILIKKGFKVE